MEINFLKMSSDEKKKLATKLLSLKKGIILLDGPTGSGKTFLLKMIMEQEESAIKFSEEEISGKMVAEIKYADDLSGAIKKITDELSGYNIIGIEDVDFLSAKQAMQEAIAKTTNILAERALVIITGIDIEKRTSYMTEKLKKNEIIYMK